LVISRRAKRFRDECDSDGAHVAINKATKQANLSTDATEFNQLIKAASHRNQGACRELGRTAEILAPHLPGKSGRPISLETCIHIMFQHQLEYVGVQGAYTFSEIEGGDFVDPVTQATRLAVNNPDFIYRQQRTKAMSGDLRAAKYLSERKERSPSSEAPKLEDPYDLSRLIDEELGDLERLLGKASDETQMRRRERTLGSSTGWGIAAVPRFQDRERGAAKGETAILPTTNAARRRAPRKYA
jgi:hypothetical protein